MNNTPPITEIITGQNVSNVLQKIRDSKTEMEFMKTGFPKVDAWLDGGFFRKELIIIGGHTGIGKSYIAGQLMFNIAKQAFKSAYFSLEISNEMIVSRMLGAVANLKPTRVRMGLLTPDEYRGKIRAEAELEGAKDFLYFYDTMYRLDEIIESIKLGGYEFVIVDFIQNVVGEGRDEYQRLSNVALLLQQAAKATNSTIVGLSQLSNSVAREGSKGKVLEYKGSGSIATVCDLGFFIERGDGEWNQFADNPLKLSLRKNRRGGSGIEFNLYFKTPGGKIYES
jgi:replicative DNA helicase